MRSGLGAVREAGRRSGAPGVLGGVSGSRGGQPGGGDWSLISGAPRDRGKYPHFYLMGVRMDWRKTVAWLAPPH
ncbi:hypothetical protein Slala01_19600 [Streptomyces lavendulae subsp. lavendulae]|nr:hypothetical protein Slala01_19600 [Streptomyces lavendulae subsp. lavendulae]